MKVEIRDALGTHLSRFVFCFMRTLFNFLQGLLMYIWYHWYVLYR